MESPPAEPAHEQVTRRYFELSARIQEAKRRGDYKGAIAAARETLPLLRPFVAATIRDYGSWDIRHSEAIHTAGTLMAVEQDSAAIAGLRATLQAIPELSNWLPAADQAETDLASIARITAAIRAHRGLQQVDLKAVTAISDGRRMSTLVSYLERGGHIRRVRVGNTYQLYLADVPPSAFIAAAPVPSAPSPAASSASPAANTLASPLSWQGRPARHPRELDLKRMRLIRLPMAPRAWEQAEATRGRAPAPKKTRDGTAFTVTGEGWALAEARKLAPEERPDPAFRQSYPGRRWTYWLDPRGRTTRWPQAPCIVQVTDPVGTLTAERGLSWDTYRIDANVDGSAILFLSREGVLHGYDHSLQPLLMARLPDLPEYRACAERLGIPEDSLRTHVRCVAISTDRTRYLVTVVDEAWCLSISGDVLWGLRFPTSDGWAPVTRSADRVGPSSAVMQALALLGIRLPVTPEDITRAYRHRALEWHPDRNPGDPSAVERMQELNAAMALLTGTDVSALSVSQIDRVTMYEDLTTRQTITVPSGFGFTISITVGPLHAADWIYAANFGRDGRVYLAGYSGRVVEVSSEGSPVRGYDIGAVPRHVVDTAHHLYVLTDTRLYVLSGDQLVALLDVFEQGRLIVAEAGLGLLDQKSFTWLSPSGQTHGTVQSRDPIRRVLRTTAGLIVESRRLRAIVDGTPPWW